MPNFPILILGHLTSEAVYTWGGIIFDNYSLAKILILPSNCDDDNPITFHDGASDYQVPAGKVFIAGKVAVAVKDTAAPGRIGESNTVDGAISKEVLSGLIGPADYLFGYLDVFGVYAAGKYVTGEGTYAGTFYEMVAGTILYGVEVSE